MINKHIVVGRIGNPPEVRTVADNKKVATFSVATTEQWRDAKGEMMKHTEWIDVVAWSPLADIIDKYAGKGDLVYVEGKQKTRHYDKDGHKIYVTETIADNFRILANAPDKPAANP